MGNPIVDAATTRIASAIANRASAVSQASRRVIGRPRQGAGAARITGIEADRVHRDVVPVQDRRADPARAVVVDQDLAGGLDAVVGLEHEPPDPVRLGDLLDGVQRIVDQHDPRMAGPVPVAGGIDRHHAIGDRGAGLVERRSDRLHPLPPALPVRVDGEGARDGGDHAERHGAADEHARGRRRVPALAPRRHRCRGQDDPLEGQHVAVRGERDGRVDERPARHVHGGDQRAEREQQHGEAEIRAERGVVATPPGAHDHERDEQQDPDQDAEDEHGRDEPADRGS